MSTQETFIQQIAPLIQKYAKQYGIKVASPIIAQACLESAYGKSGLAKFHNYFGMKTGPGWKGASVSMKTKEEYTQGLVEVDAAFRAYPNMDEGVKGYFEFISKPRYSNLKTAVNAEQYLILIKNDGYATSSWYVQNTLAVVDKYNLRKYDAEVAPELVSVNYFVELTANVNLRSSFSAESVPLLPQPLPKRMVLKITHECDGWGKVGNIDGWICLKYSKKI